MSKKFDNLHMKPIMLLGCVTQVYLWVTVSLWANGRARRNEILQSWLFDLYEIQTVHFWMIREGNMSVCMSLTESWLKSDDRKGAWASRCDNGHKKGWRHRSIFWCRTSEFVPHRVPSENLLSSNWTWHYFGNRSSNPLCFLSSASRSIYPFPPISWAWQFASFNDTLNERW